MVIHELEKLIQSLSPAEKKNFKLHSAKYEGEKDYLLLFNIMADGSGKKPTEVEELFKRRSKSNSFSNTVNYLLKALIDHLTTVRIGQDKWFSRHYSLMKARLCFERSLPEKGLQELRKVRKLSEQAQDHNLYYQAVRGELNYMTDMGFGSFSEQEVVDLQMKSKRSLKILHQIHEHHSLYELLKHKLLNQGIEMENNNKVVNDLILGELSIINAGAQHQFESKKTHLLFQSFFLVHTKQYHSAFKVFKDLHTLFEENESFWNYPPYDNLSALDGILENLHNMKYYEEMGYFIQKLENLYSRTYPEHFKNLTFQTLCLYRLNKLIGLKEYKAAIEFSKSIQEEVLLSSSLNKTDKQLKLMLFTSLAYFHNQQYEQANKYILYALNDNRFISTHIIYRICRLLHIMIHYELENFDYLDYEIRAYKRSYKQHGKAFKTEKLVFDIIKTNPKHCSTARKKIILKKISPIIDLVLKSKQEEIFLKYNNFCEWAASFLNPKMTKQRL